MLDRKGYENDKNITHSFPLTPSHSPSDPPPPPPPLTISHSGTIVLSSPRGQQVLHLAVLLQTVQLCLCQTPSALTHHLQSVTIYYH